MLYVFKVKDKDTKTNLFDVILLTLFLNFNPFGTFNLMTLRLVLSTYLPAWTFAQYVASIIDSMVDFLYGKINIITKPTSKSYKIQSIASGNPRD